MERRLLLEEMKRADQASLRIEQLMTRKSATFKREMPQGNTDPATRGAVRWFDAVSRSKGHVP